MACLTDEQLAGLALNLESSEAFAAHVGECDSCRNKLTDLCQLTQRLSAAHAELDAVHSASRAQLLATLANVKVTARPGGIGGWLHDTVARLSPRQRIAAGGLGLSTAVALVLLVLAIANSATPLSAMERLAKAVREVKSYSYKMRNLDTFVAHGQNQPTTIVHTSTVHWLESAGLLYDEQIVRTGGPVYPRERAGGLFNHITGIHPAGKPGILVYHDGRSVSMIKTFNRIPALREVDAGKDSPITKLRMVREGDGKVLRELGTKTIRGKNARGFVMALHAAKPGSGFDALEVWVDPETDLPLEFGYELSTGELKRVFRITDCRWNIDLDPKLFDATPPAGYVDISPPTDEKDIAGIAAALKLYADLSGGRYPGGTNLDAGAVHDEMLKLAGFTGPARPEWTNDKRFQQIRQAKPSLDWLARLLRNTTNTGYFGDAVRPEDKEKALLWWNVARSATENPFRVFYGDLRTEILPVAKWAELVSPDVAGPHLPQGGGGRTVTVKVKAPQR
jgi:outer membrane lipoprotein-sorting protein